MKKAKAKSKSKRKVQRRSKVDHKLYFTMLEPKSLRDLPKAILAKQRSLQSAIEKEVSNHNKLVKKNDLKAAKKLEGRIRKMNDSMNSWLSEEFDKAWKAAKAAKKQAKKPIKKAKRKSIDKKRRATKKKVLAKLKVKAPVKKVEAKREKAA